MALPLLLGAAKGLIGSGKKKPKSGKEVAGKLVKRKEQKDNKKPSVQKKIAPAQVSGKKFFAGKSSTPKIDKLKPNTGNGQLDDVLNSIQSSVSKLAGTIKNFVKFKRKDSQEKTKRKNKMLARLREVGFGMIGGVLSLGKKLLSKIPFFDRIKNFFVNILLGGLVLMILDNIKPIIEVIKGVVEKAKEVFALINKYLFQPMIEAGKFVIDTVLPIINDIINSAPAEFIKTQIESLIKTIGDQFPQLEKVVEDLKNIDIPGKGLLKDLIGTDNSPDGSIPGSAGRTTFEVIAGGEGGYNSVNQGNAGDTPGGSQELFGKDLTEMTVGEIMDAQASGKVFAVGKYQIIDTTMAEWVNHPKGGVSRSDKFNEATQEKFKTYVINIKRPEIGRYLRGESDDVVAAAQGVAREFASVGLSRPEAGRRVDQSRYAGIGDNAASISSREIQQALKFDRGQYQQQQPPALRPSGTQSPGSTNGKFGQISSGYGDTDGQDTGVDIELYGKEGKIGKKYGNQSAQGPYGGRGVPIAFPYELTYNEFVPGGRNQGAKSITSQGSTNREIKGQGAGGFGYIGSYTYTDENGKRYEIMMGHGNQPFNQFKEGEKIPAGTVLGYQGATGSSDDAAGGLYDHITFHVNTMDGGDANKVIRKFTNALIGGEGVKIAPEQPQVAPPAERQAAEEIKQTEQPQIAPPAERQTAKDISTQTYYEKMRTIFMPIAVPTGGSGGDSGSGGGGPTVIAGESSRDTYLQIALQKSLFSR